MFNSTNKFVEIKKMYFNASPFHENSHHFVRFGCTEQAPKGPSRKTATWVFSKMSQNFFLSICHFV
jgi:hypothetical protein